MDRLHKIIEEVKDSHVQAEKTHAVVRARLDLIRENYTNEKQWYLPVVVNTKIDNALDV